MTALTPIGVALAAALGSPMVGDSSGDDFAHLCGRRLRVKVDDLGPRLTQLLGVVEQRSKLTRDAFAGWRLTIGKFACYAARVHDLPRTAVGATELGGLGGARTVSWTRTRTMPPREGGERVRAFGRADEFFHLRLLRACADPNPNARGRRGLTIPTPVRAQCFS